MIKKSSNLRGVKKFASASSNHSALPVYNPLPLRCFHEKIGFFSGKYFRHFQKYDHVDHDQHKAVQFSGIDHDSKPKSQMKNRKRKNVSTHDHERKKRTRKGKSCVLPEEEEEIMTEIGTKIVPVLLYEKQLKDSDQDMLVINRSPALMHFLNKEENTGVVNTRDGLEFSGKMVRASSETVFEFHECGYNYKRMKQNGCSDQCEEE